MMSVRTRSSMLRLGLALVSIGVASSSFALPSPTPVGGTLPQLPPTSSQQNSEGVNEGPLDTTQTRQEFLQNDEEVLGKENQDPEKMAPPQQVRNKEVGLGGGMVKRLPYLNPYEGLSATQNSGSALELVQKSTTSKLGLLNAVNNLTEPGIAAAVTSTFTQSGHIWGGQVGAEQLFLETASMEREGQEFAKTRQNCISRKMSERIPVSEAINACSGGGVIHTSASIGAAPVGMVAGPGASLSESDRNHARYQDALSPRKDFAESPCQGDNEVCGTDYLFNQEIRLSTDVNTQDRLSRARNEFLDLIGDVRFKSETANGNVQTISYSAIPPRIEGSADQIIARQQRTQYENLNELMKRFCEWSFQICSGTVCGPGSSFADRVKAQYPTKAGDITTSNSNSEIRDFWRDSRAGKQLRMALSSTQLSMHSRIIENLYTLYKRDSNFAERTIGSGADGACGGFYTGSGEPANYDVLYGGAARPATDDIVNVNAEWHKPIYELSKLIGEVNYLDFLAQHGQLINNKLITASGLTSQVRTQMLTLLNRTAVAQSTTGSVTIDQELMTKARAMQELIVKNVIEPARESVASATDAQKRALTSVGEAAGRGSTISGTGT